MGDDLVVNEHRDDTGTADGVIRFTTADLSFRRFSAGFGFPTDLTIGRDGLLYTMDVGPANTTVSVHHPVTMEPLRTLNIPQPLRSLAVDAGGNLYATTDTGVTHFAADGTVVKNTVQAVGKDITLAADGRLLVASPVQVIVTDTDFSQFVTIAVPGDPAINTASFATFVIPPVDPAGGGGGGDFGVFTAGNILVSNSPRTGGLPQLMEYTAMGQLVREYDIPVFEPGGAATWWWTPRTTCRSTTGRSSLG